jgi:deazaflavin-dependent oxidoreductase (nitroreductase family)
MARRRQLSRLDRALEDFARKPIGGWIAVNIANPIDRRLLRYSKGRFGLFLGQQVGLLEHTGAKSGAARETPLLYIRDGENIVIVASKAGATKHPAWYHNVIAHPEVGFLARGRDRRYIAREAEGEERERLWEEVNDYYAGYEDYSRRTEGRRIPLIVLEPVLTAS